MTDQKCGLMAEGQVCFYKSYISDILFVSIILTVILGNT